MKNQSTYFTPNNTINSKIFPINIKINIPISTINSKKTPLNIKINISVGTINSKVLHST